MLEYLTNEWMNVACWWLNLDKTWVVIKFEINTIWDITTIKTLVTTILATVIAQRDEI